jgi:hypothetical protein
MKANRRSPTGYDRDARTIEFATNTERQYGLQLLLYSTTHSSFRISLPSDRLNGLYYCEWVFKGYIPYRSPAFNLVIEGMLQMKHSIN